MKSSSAYANMGPDDHTDKLTEIDMTAERMVQVGSVLRIIDESIKKLKISLMLPKIFENPTKLRQSLSGTKYEKCVGLVVAYLKDKKNQTMKDPHLNYKLIKLIDMFYEKIEIIEFLPNWLAELGSDDKALLDAFHLLYNITDQRLRKSAVSELSKERKIHQIYHENEVVKKNILEFQKKLHSQTINSRWKLAAKDGIIQKYEEDLACKKWNNNVRVKAEIVQSSMRIQSIQNASIAKQKELEEELERSKDEYDKVLSSNLHQEKEIRDEKNKLLFQLESLIKKYDQNIGEKIKENIHLHEEYEEQKKQFDEFFVIYQSQAIEYDTVVHQKEEEDKRKHEEKLMLFMMNRAARVIQIFWRRFRREQRKKSKKGKGGKGAKGKKR